MLKYCAWCGTYQGATPAAGYQIRENVCEIDTATICPSCLPKLLTAAKEDVRVIHSESHGASALNKIATSSLLFAPRPLEYAKIPGEAGSPHQKDL